jgi:hypothetical protein
VFGGGGKGGLGYYLGEGFEGVGGGGMGGLFVNPFNSYVRW